MEIRLQKYLADAGVASRRKCEEMISAGRIEVDGRIITEAGTKVDGSEKICLDGREIRLEQQKVYILLHKPVGYITTSKDQFDRRTVLDLIEPVKERIFPVGRLDYDTSGLILLTNDGELTNRLTHPRHQIEKVYRAKIMGHLSGADMESIRKGFPVEDYTTAPAAVKITETSMKDSVVELTIREGKNRQVRKMFEALNHPVMRLKRISIGPLSIDGIEEGKWRHLSESELLKLMGLTGKRSL